MSWASVGRGWQKGLLCGKTQLKSTFSHHKHSVSSLLSYVFNRSCSNTLNRWKYMNGLTGIFVFSTSYPMQWHSDSRAIMASLRIQASSHTWLCSQFLSHFLHLEAPTRVISSQQKLWKWQAREQIPVTQYLWAPCSPPAFPSSSGWGCCPPSRAGDSSQMNWRRLWATASQLDTDNRMEAATSEVQSFPPLTSPRKSCVVTKVLQTCPASASMSTRQVKIPYITDPIN